jgi:hypothetical protein
MPKNRHLAMYTTLCLKYGGNVQSSVLHNSVNITRLSKKFNISSHIMLQSCLNAPKKATP